MSITSLVLAQTNCTSQCVHTVVLRTTPTVCVLLPFALQSPKCGFISLMANYPKIFWDCSFPHDIVYVSLLATYDPNTWFVKLRPECSHKMCVVSLHLTTQHRQVSMTSALRPQKPSDLRFSHLHEPPKWGFILQSQNMGFISPSTSRPKTATRFLSPMAPQKMVSLPSALYTRNNMSLLPLASWAQKCAGFTFPKPGF